MKDHLKKDINTDEEEIEDITEDVEFEELDNEGDELDNNGKVKKLREKIKKLEEEKKEYLDLSQRLRADYANLKKEVEENRSKTIKLANRGLMEDILPVLDSYTMAQGNKEAWEKVDQNWRIGIEYIFNQLSSVLEGNGLVSFGNVGEKFDPNIHESVEIIKTDDKAKDDTIENVLAKGYKLGDMVLRPARVKTYHLA